MSSAILLDLEDGLEYSQNLKTNSIIHVDLNWANESATAGGMATIMGSTGLSWYALQHKLVAFSCTEAEFISLCFDSTETFWTRRLLQNTGLVTEVE